MTHYGIYGDPPQGNEEYIIPMFSTPLMHLKVEDWEEKKKALLEMYEKRKSDKSKFKVATGSKTSLDVETDYHHNYDTGYAYDEDIMEIFQSELEALADTFECSVEVCTTWFEKASTTKFHQVHNHGCQGFSAVCFIQFDPKHHTPTVFMNPNLADVETCNIVPPGIREGSLIFFPSYVLHYTAPNQSDVDRIILSFNVNAEYEHFTFAEENAQGPGEYNTTDV
jgi:hypothetical protein